MWLQTAARFVDWRCVAKIRRIGYARDVLGTQASASRRTAERGPAASGRGSRSNVPSRFRPAASARKSLQRHTHCPSRTPPAPSSAESAAQLRALIRDIIQRPAAQRRLRTGSEFSFQGRRRRRRRRSPTAFGGCPSSGCPARRLRRGLSAPTRAPGPPARVPPASGSGPGSRGRLPCREGRPTLPPRAAVQGGPPRARVPPAEPRSDSGPGRGRPALGRKSAQEKKRPRGALARRRPGAGAGRGRLAPSHWQAHLSERQHGAARREKMVPLPPAARGRRRAHSPESRLLFILMNPN